MAFKSIHTEYGLDRLAEAQTGGVVINLTHMAVGDGGGVSVTPNATQTALVNERYRAAINTVYRDPADPKQLFVEMTIPADTGGWWIRECGIFDDAGQLFAVANYPETYKTVLSDGVVSEHTVRILMIVSNVDVITLQVDPAIVMASRKWVTDNVNAATIAPGGTTLQVWTKNSNLDGDASWQTPGSQTVLVNTLEEVQTLAANQLTINMVQRTTLGLSVVVEGLRLPKRAGPNGWQEGASNTQIILGGPTGGGYYPVGTEVTMLQNQPVSSLPDVLDANQNLNDVQNKATSRTNLDVYSKSETDQKAPPSLIGYFARSTAPAGWLKANGAAVSRTTYAALFAAIGTTFGSGDGSTTFNLPDLRGEFIRGVDDGRGVDAGRALGSAQSWATAAQTGSVQLGKPGDFGSVFNPTGILSTPGDVQVNRHEGTGGGGGALTLNISVGTTGATETRPRNRAMLACIKF